MHNGPPLSPSCCNREEVESMNIALLGQAVQGTAQKNGEAGASPTGHFLQLLTSMLGSFTDTPQQPVKSDGESAQSLPTEELSSELERWLQQPDSLEWLKGLPRDAYRQFMDAYTSLLTEAASLESMSPEAMVPATNVVAHVLDGTKQTAHASIIPAMIERDLKRDVPSMSTRGGFETNVRIVQQIVTQFNGTFGQAQNTLPEGKQPETPLTTIVKESLELLPKGGTWTRPQIDVDTVMYASKSSLPENLKARIEAALQRAPFQSGADGSKVFTVRLYPEQLGELVVKLERQNGELVVKLFASNQDAKQLLQSQLQQLHQTLQPLTPNVRIEVNLTQQALDAKTPTSSGEQPDAEREGQQQPKGESDDDDHPTEDE